MTRIALLSAAIALSISATAQAGYSPEHDKAQRHFQSDAEPTAKDAIWTAPDIFKIGVQDNGANRDGYAEYACSVLNEHGFAGKRIWVQIIDIDKLVREQRWVKLGETWCASSSEPPTVIEFPAR